jgi:hypothetical protein
MCMLTYFFFVFCLFLIWETSSIFLSLCPIECRLNSNSVSRIARARSWLRHHRQFHIHITSTRLSVSIGRGNESKDFQAQKKCYPWRGYFFKQNEIQRHRFLVDPWMWHAMIGIVSFQFNGQDVFGHDFTILYITVQHRSIRIIFFNLSSIQISMKLMIYVTTRNLYRLLATKFPISAKLGACLILINFVWWSTQDRPRMVFLD